MRAWENARMATSKPIMLHILDDLAHPDRFATRPMFGEYALYADGKVVGFICDGALLVKILPASAALAKRGKLGKPYPEAKDYYLVEAREVADVPGLAQILFDIADGLPQKKAARRKAKT